MYIANYRNNTDPKKVVVFSNCEEVELRINGKAFCRKLPDSGATTDFSTDGITHPYMYESQPEYAASHGDMGVAVSCCNYDAINEIREMYNNNVFFDGGNCKKIEHPPFTFFNIEYQEGTIEAVGFVDGKETAREVRKSALAPSELKITVDECEKVFESDGNTIFSYVDVVDSNGTVVYDNNSV